MSKFRIDRLRKLADHLLHGQLGHKFFYFNVYSDGERAENGCGTSGCAIGECPIAFPDEWKFDKHGQPVLIYGEITQTEYSAMDFFNLCLEEYNELFIPNSQANVTGIFLDAGATKEQVAERILKFCDLKHW